MSSIPSRLSPTETILAAWIAGLSGTIAAGWILSSADALRFDWVAALIIWAAVVICTLRYLVTQPSSFSLQVSSFKSALRFPPFLIFGVIIFATAFLYLPVTHDSLCYRIPRMYLWLQEGHVGYVPTSDPRINYMTHNWELASLPVLQIFGVRFLPAVSVVSWILLYLLGRSWAGVAGFQDKMQNWAGLLPALTTFSVLQARSTVNDLFAATLIFASAWFAFSFHRSPDRWKLVLSAFALALACGTKPHYIVLGAPWGLWLIFGRPSPWRSIPWRHVAWLLPIFLFVTPLPAFIINTVEIGSYKGTTGADNFIGGNPVWNVILGSISFLWQSLQLPLNPLAGLWNSHLSGIPILATAVSAVPRFSLTASYAQIVDFATVGTVVMVGCIVGWWRAVRLKSIRGLQWIAAAGALGFVLAVSQVVPSTIGRSFMGFFFLLTPLALAGLYTLRHQLLMVLFTITAASAGISIAFDASRPLVPTKTLAGLLEGFGFDPGAASPLVANFIGFRDRSEAGVELFRRIPNGSRLAIISGAGDPLVGAWLQARPASVHLAPVDADMNWVKNLAPDVILVTGTGPEMHTVLIRQISERYRRVGTEYYLVRLQRGKEKWELFVK